MAERGTATERFDKRPLTESEEKEALTQNAAMWDRQNPNHPVPMQEWQDKLDKAKAEGYVSEKCGCGCDFLAFHHWTTCRDARCPMSDGISMLQRMQESLKEATNAD